MIKQIIFLALSLLVIPLLEASEQKKNKVVLNGDNDKKKVIELRDEIRKTRFPTRRRIDIDSEGPAKGPQNREKTKDL